MRLYSLPDQWIRRKYYFIMTELLNYQLMRNFRNCGGQLVLMLWMMQRSMSIQKSKVRKVTIKLRNMSQILCLHLVKFFYILKHILLGFAGIRSMQDHGIKKQIAPKRKKANQRKRQFKKPRDNEHLADVLETYEDNTLTQKNSV